MYESLKRSFKGVVTERKKREKEGICLLCLHKREREVL